MRIAFTATGTPAPQGSKKAYIQGGRALLVDASTKTKPWRQRVEAAARQALPLGHMPITLPVQVAITFTMPRPQAHYRTGQYAGQLKPTAPNWCPKRPDLDKLARSTLDALTTAGVYRDDSQVTYLSLGKVYVGFGGTPGARIVVSTIDGDGQ